MTTGYRKLISQSLQEAAEIAKNSFGKVAGISKPEDNNQVLTETDLKIGKMLAEKIKEKFPDYNIIDEEAGVVDNHSDFTWVIDPIDGTSNFASGVPLYGIMMGLLKNDSPIAGGFILPAFSEIYTAEKGKGTYCNSKKINVSKESKLDQSLIAYGIDAYQNDPKFTRDECALLSEILLNIRNLRMSNSAFDFAMVAKGNYGAFLNQTSKIWDNVAPQIVIEEAGGIYTDFFGKPMDYSNALSRPQDNFTFLAASPYIHKKLLAIIKGKTI